MPAIKSSPDKMQSKELFEGHQGQAGTASQELRCPLAQESSPLVLLKNAGGSNSRAPSWLNPSCEHLGSSLPSPPLHPASARLLFPSLPRWPWDCPLPRFLQRLWFPHGEDASHGDADEGRVGHAAGLYAQVGHYLCRPLSLPPSCSQAKHQEPDLPLPFTRQTARIWAPELTDQLRHGKPAAFEKRNNTSILYFVRSFPFPVRNNAPR